MGEGPNKQREDPKCQRNTRLEMVAAEPQGMNILPAREAEVNLSATLINRSSRTHHRVLVAGHRKPAATGREVRYCSLAKQPCTLVWGRLVCVSQIPRQDVSVFNSNATDCYRACSPANPVPLRGKPLLGS